MKIALVIAIATCAAFAADAMFDARALVQRLKAENTLCHVVDELARSGEWCALRKHDWQNQTDNWERCSICKTVREKPPYKFITTPVDQ